MRATRTQSIAVAITAATLLAACQGSGRPDPTVNPPPRPYTAEEIELYREAVQRVEDFEVRNQPILAAGKATDEARQLYRDTLRAWQWSFAQLQAQESQGIRIARAPVVLSTRATSIKSFQDNAAEIVLSRCTDQSNLGTTRNGEPVRPVHEQPVVQTVLVHRWENRTWRIGPIATTKDPCTA